MSSASESDPSALIKALIKEIRVLQAENARLSDTRDVASHGGQAASEDSFEGQSAREQTVEERAALNHAAEATAHILRLPSEILDSIFFRLSENKSFISACRLVCHLFKDLSSPYLITSVTFSRRIKVARKLAEVLKHDYFRKHVTELVWDASRWDERYVLNFDAYYESGLASGRSFHDAEADAQRREWRSFWNIRPYIAGVGPTSFEEVSPNDDDHYNAAVQNSHHLGQYQYTRSWLTQQAMEKWTMQSGVALQCVDRLPKLRSIIYTDYRCLAEPDDTDYNTFCQRTMGNAAPPHHLGEVEYDDGLLYEDLEWLLYYVSEYRPGRITAFKIGHNPFGYPLSTSEHEPLPQCDNAQVILHRHLDWIDDEGIIPAFKSLRELRLPQRFVNSLTGRSEGVEHTILNSKVPKLLAACTQTLVRLTYAAEDIVTWDNVDGRPSRWNSALGGENALESILCPLTSEKLAYLDLRGWEIDLRFCTFLERHKSTLKQVHLVGNVVRDVHIGAESILATKAGSNLALEGVAIDNFPIYLVQEAKEDGSYPEDPGPPPHYTRSQKELIEKLWLSGRGNILENIAVEIKPYQKSDEKRELTWRNAEIWAD